MAKKQKLEEIGFCDFSCKFAEPDKYVPGCHTINPIYCKKKKRIVAKSMPCEDYELRN